MCIRDRDKPIDLEYKNVTIYNYSRNQRLINIESAVGSKLVMEGILLASPCGDLFAIGANTTTTFSNNYTTCLLYTSAIMINTLLQ